MGRIRPLVGGLKVSRPLVTAVGTIVAIYRTAQPVNLVAVHVYKEDLLSHNMHYTYCDITSASTSLQRRVMPPLLVLPLVQLLLFPVIYWRSAGGQTGEQRHR